ncbi:MAG: ABC transporter substrate-binding protein [Pseudomonadota bacterium]
MIRRLFLGSLTAFGLIAGPAASLDEQTAITFVSETIDEVVVMMTDGGEGPANVTELRRIVDRRIALDAVARFVIGAAWRDMSDDQRSRFAEAFASSVTKSYAGRFEDFRGDRQAVRDSIAVRRAIDAGRKGTLVETEISPPSLPTIRMDFLVSDRPGRPAIVDVIIEGVSLAVTQRDIITGMLDARGGDVEVLIADLQAHGS